MELVRWTEPRTSLEARKLRDAFVQQQLALQAALANKSRDAGGGRKMSDREYSAWRAHTIATLSETAVGIRQAKAAIRRLVQRESAAIAGVDPSSPVSLLAALHRVARKYSDVLDERERALVDAVQLHLDNGAPF
jgi:hypothetical protein